MQGYSFRKTVGIENIHKDNVITGVNYTMAWNLNPPTKLMFKEFNLKVADCTL